MKDVLLTDGVGGTEFVPVTDAEIRSAVDRMIQRDTDLTRFRILENEETGWGWFKNRRGEGSGPDTPPRSPRNQTGEEPAFVDDDQAERDFAALNQQDEGEPMAEVRRQDIEEENTRMGEGEPEVGTLPGEDEVMELSEIHRDVADPREAKIRAEREKLRKVIDAMDILLDDTLRAGERKTYETRRQTAIREMERLEIQLRALGNQQRGTEAYQRGIQIVKRGVDRALNVPERVVGAIAASPARIEAGVKRVEHGVQNTLNRVDAWQARSRNRLADGVVETMRDTTGWVESQAYGAKAVILEKRSRLAGIVAGARAIVTELRLRGDFAAVERDERRAAMARSASDDAIDQDRGNAAYALFQQEEDSLKRAADRKQRILTQIQEMNTEEPLGASAEERLYMKALNAKAEAAERRGNGRTLGRFRNWLGRLIDAR
jgi:hypothetical protein